MATPAPFTTGDVTVYTAHKHLLEDTYLPICIHGHAQTYFKEHPTAETLVYSLDRSNKSTTGRVTSVAVDGGHQDTSLAFDMFSARMCGPRVHAVRPLVSSVTLTREEALATPVTYEDRRAAMCQAFPAIHRVRTDGYEGGKQAVTYLDASGCEMTDFPMGTRFGFKTREEALAAPATGEGAMLTLPTWLREQFETHAEYADALFKCTKSLETMPSRDTYSVLFRDAAGGTVAEKEAGVWGGV